LELTLTVGLVSVILGLGSVILGTLARRSLQVSLPPFAAARQARRPPRGDLFTEIADPGKA